MFDRGVPSICYGAARARLLPDRPARHEERSALRVVRRRRRQSGDGAGADPGADEGSRRPHQDPGLLRRRAGRCATRSARSGRRCRSTRSATARIWARRSCSARAATRRSSACGRGRRSRSTACSAGFTGEGAKTVIPAVAMAKVSMRLVPDQDPDKIAQLFEDYVREGRAEDGRGEGHAHARRQAVDDRLRQPVRPGRRPRDREGLRQDAGVLPRRRIDPGRVDVPGDARACRPCCSASACRTRTRTRRTRGSISATSTTASSRRRILYDEIGEDE